MYCYRRYGHNENDDASFTQPLVATRIREREPMRVTFARNVVALGAITAEEADAIAAASRSRLEAALEMTKAVADPTETGARAKSRWSAYRGEPVAETAGVDTTVPEPRLAELLTRTVAFPDACRPHRVIERLREARLDMARGARPIDWSAAEALAFATLVTEGHPIRLSGQDSERGTFGHRHAVVHDQRTDATSCALATLAADQAPFRVFNSPLSETAVLGFDWGYSLERPTGLTIWEAQFGDFANVAQVIVDQFVSSAEQKWGLLSGLCLFLPHGFEGQGPEHSSARLERFLSLGARDNLQIANLTTASQLFHALRLQVKAPWRKPLIVMTPKALLRHPAASSPLSELTGGGFRPVIVDAETPLHQTERVLFCSGKIAHELAAERATRGANGVAIVRVERLHPFPAQALQAAVKATRMSTRFFWVQEEPENMGAWPYIQNRLGGLLPAGARLGVIARAASASPATGSKARHDAEQAELKRRAFEDRGVEKPGASIGG
jgi:2-oxoglutarate dehydrogenase E1 component